MMKEFAMARFHVVPDTGMVKPCKATVGVCKYGEEVLHGSSVKETLALYEAHMQDSLFVGHSASDTDEEVRDDWNGDNRKKYSILGKHYEAALKKIASANRRLTKAGINGQFDFTETKRFVPREEVDRLTGIKTSWAEVYYDIELNEPKLAYDGYEFLAVMNREGKGFFVRSRKGVELEGERPDKMVCDHCGHNRERNKTYLIKGPDGETKQIGSTCVDAYLGIKPEGLWALEYDALDSFSEGSDSNHQPVPHYSVDDTLSIALAASDGGENFKPSSWDHSTSAAVADIRFGGKHVDVQWRREMFEKASEMKSSGKVAQLRSMINQMDDNSDYARNLKAAVSEEYASPRAQSIVISAVSIIKREEKAKQWAAEREQRRIAEESKKDMFKAGHIGKKDEKLKDVTYEVIEAREYSSSDFHGNPITKYATTMRDSDGHKLTFFASEDLTKIKDDENKVTFSSGRIKEHSNYEGQDQTILSHMRVRKPKAS